ncbi:MAG TPA: hypothetical protein VI168_01605 [Croceibacterium sp.]
MATTRVELFCSQALWDRVSALAVEGMRTAAAMLAVNSNLRMMELLKRAKARFSKDEQTYTSFVPD